MWNILKYFTYYCNNIINYKYLLFLNKHILEYYYNKYTNTKM